MGIYIRVENIMEIVISINIDEKEVKDVQVICAENKKTSEDVKTITPIVSDYARFFDETCPGWSNNSEHNLMYLKELERYATAKLKADGRLYLNDVYDMLGIPRTKAGAIVGWTYDEQRPIGDNYVSFGIYNNDDMNNRDFINGYKNVALLDFNVDGNIRQYFV